MSQRAHTAGKRFIVSMALAFLAIACVWGCLLLTRLVLPDSRYEYRFSEYGYWGVSPTEVVASIDSNTEINRIAAAIDSIELVGIHVSRKVKSRIEAVDALVDLIHFSRRNFVGVGIDREGNLEPGVDAIAKWNSVLDKADVVEILCYRALESHRSAANTLHDAWGNCDELLRRIESAQSEVEPPDDATVREYWPSGQRI